MKNVLSLFVLVMLVSPIFGQEADENAGGSLIANIMSVNPVEVTVSEEVEKAGEEYQKTLDEEKSKLDKAIAKEGENYTKDVTEHISKYQKVLAKAIVQDVNNEKKAVGTKVNSATFSTRKNKKSLLTTFNNKMSSEIRDMPQEWRDEKKEELATMVEEYLETFDSEFDANQEVIKQFKSTEHLVQQASTGGSGEQ